MFTSQNSVHFGVPKKSSSIPCLTLDFVSRLFMHHTPAFCLSGRDCVTNTQASVVHLSCLFHSLLLHLWIQTPFDPRLASAFRPKQEKETDGYQWRKLLAIMFQCSRSRFVILLSMQFLLRG